MSNKPSNIEFSHHFESDDEILDRDENNDQPLRMTNHASETRTQISNPQQAVMSAAKKATITKNKSPSQAKPLLSRKMKRMFD